MEEDKGGGRAGKWKFRNNSFLKRTDPDHKDRWHKQRITENISTLQWFKDTFSHDAAGHNKIARAIKFWQEHK
jgi:hypothetical protein